MLPAIYTWGDMKAAMFSFMLPTFAAAMIVGFGIAAFVGEISGGKKSEIVKYIVIMCGCVLIAWFVYTMKSDKATEYHMSAQALEILRRETADVRGRVSIIEHERRTEKERGK